MVDKESRTNGVTDKQGEHLTVFPFHLERYSVIRELCVCVIGSHHIAVTLPSDRRTRTVMYLASQIPNLLLGKQTTVLIFIGRVFVLPAYSPGGHMTQE